MQNFCTFLQPPEAGVNAAKLRANMRTLMLGIWAILLLGLLGCEKAADISSPIKYEKENVSFSYPQNWKVTEDVGQQDVRYLFVESPGDAIFMALIYSKNDAVPLSEFVEWFSSQSREETPIGNVGKSSFSAVEKNKFSPRMKGIKENFAISLLGEQTPHIREYYAMDTKNKIAFLVAQAATEDLSKVAPGFDLILSSFAVK
jgi:hypothetical protein